MRSFLFIIAFHHLVYACCSEKFHIFCWFISLEIMSSITLTLTGDSSHLSAQYCPEIDLSDGEYVCGLIDFQTFNSIPNIDETNNLFYFGHANLLQNEGNRNNKNDKNDKNSNNESEDRTLNSVDLIEESDDTSNSVEEEEEERGKQAEEEEERLLTNRVRNKKRKKRAIVFAPVREPIALTCVKIPTGSYELDHLAQYLQRHVALNGGKLVLHANTNTLHCEIYCNQPIDFSRANTIGPLLGYKIDQVLRAYETHESQLPANILKVNVIRIECSIITGSYLNNKPSHSIHEFSPRVPPGYKIIEVPQNVIYYPITVRHIQNIDLSIVDQQNRLINFRGETITARLHIKKVN